ncbi:MAG TPA: bifunctional hydroxymethylpyrimidine kinase/phosphomethylpyrimidine kinase [Candidatus Binatia bacterium]|nr:bifunctional hydroxymethylpyrimidine kinase/phosphomethylpyrimidine kinase [Candidatus Binatia bacterium]
MTRVPPPVALTIAGSDPSGGAGLQADLKTFAALDVWGAAVVAALTAQNTCGVRACADVAPAFVGAQLDAVLDDLPVAAVKTGMLARAAVVDVVAEGLGARRPRLPLVVDPVLVATSGDALAEPALAARLAERLLPLATVVTPNLAEAEALTGLRATTPAAMRDAARALVDRGARAALVTGGHLAGDPCDVLFDGAAFHDLVAPRIPLAPTHGTGCTLSAAIAAGLARGLDLLAAVAEAKAFVGRALAAATPVGRGAVPLAHGAARRDR